MNSQINFIFKDQTYKSLNVIFIDEKTIQVKEIPFHLSGIRHNDIIEVAKQNEDYIYIKKIPLF